MLVQQGVVWETTFNFHEQKGLRYNSVAEYQPGAVTGADVPDIHQLGNPDVSEQNLSHHPCLFAAPGRPAYLQTRQREIELYTPDDSDA